MNSFTLPNLHRLHCNDDRAVVRMREELTYIDCQAIGIARYLRVIEVIVDHEPLCIPREVKLGLSCTSNLIKVFILVYA
jgi:hypothetical protein